ncbi:hypothetical protein LL06_19950 [Hoeflea sp. BAL378]|nr:hypothetical protein LL06_19950 [Hoeflea sp. BAL378]
MRHFESYGNSQHKSFDEYPLSVLGRYHIDALVSMGRQDEALQKAKKYFEMIQDSERRGQINADFEVLKSRLVRFIVHFEWKKIEFKRGKIDYF